MKLALAQARQALNKDEVPVGAVLVKNNRLVSANHNRTREKNDPLAHAEKLVIEDIINEGHKYLQEYTLYITVEPCLMCAGMIIWARLGRVVFGCHDSKAGAAGSLYNVLQD
ncbi:MAG: nucleoside deaminase, partial [Candidatus Cloacimonetes bacterium]|nr:nucleoside deaminase [Candidatus Cloacimonadota bacterium]